MDAYFAKMVNNKRSKEAKEMDAFLKKIRNRTISSSTKVVKDEKEDKLKR